MSPRGSIASKLGGLGLRLGTLACLAPCLDAGEVAERIAALRGGDARVAEHAARALRELAPTAASEVLGLCSGGSAELGPLAPAERELLLASLRAWPAGVAAPALVAALSEGATLDERLTALQLVGEVGGREALALVDELCAGLSDLERAHERLGDEVVRTLARVLRRDARAYDELERRLARGELHAELLVHSAGALGAAGRGAGLAALERLLGRDATLDRAVLEALGRLRPFDQPDALHRAGRTLRRFLSAPDPELRRQAALALGELRDGEAVAELIELVDDSDGRVRRAARLALGRISGLDPSAPPETWARWHEDELAWLEREADARLADLAADEPAHVQTALRLLSMHPLGRDLVAEEIQALLPHEDAALAAAACGALVKLDDLSAFDALLEALDDAREPVRSAALAALRALTGADLGPHPEAWRTWVAPARP